MKIFSDKRLSAYRTSLRGVRRARIKLQHKLKSLGIESDDIGNTVYKVELLRIIEASFISILGKHDKRFSFENRVRFLSEA